MSIEEFEEDFREKKCPRCDANMGIVADEKRPCKKCQIELLQQIINNEQKLSTEINLVMLKGLIHTGDCAGIKILEIIEEYCNNIRSIENEEQAYKDALMALRELIVISVEIWGENTLVSEDLFKLPKEKIIEEMKKACKVLDNEVV
jgi:hypothetical protein